ncbi:hypothetical protein [Paramicrobacterium humi]|uniref:hypothetical protein n=1 Tax=Paramicrobacterium humi TaxID=640635 RepID=UPI000B883250|nr:hypothetical protein [Microbacterium humi]
MAILGAFGAIGMSDRPLQRSIAYRVVSACWGAGAATIIACVFLAALDGFSGGIFVFYFAMILGFPAAVTAGLLIGLAEAAKTSRASRSRAIRQ